MSTPGPTPSAADAPHGPLHGLRVVEMAAIGPVPFAVMLLADMGADVVRVDRIGTRGGDPSADLVARGRRSVAVDLKSPSGVQVVLDLVASADVLVEGFRPGVVERSGLGPQECLARNPALVYGRMTGWGQDGPMASFAGHDIDYIALTGALAAIGRRDAGGELRPVPPLNLLGDLGGGSMFLVAGVLAALVSAGRTGRGQIVDASVVDGTALMTTFLLGLRAQGLWDQPAGANLLDTGAPFYEVYRCADGRYLAVGAIEPRFYAELVTRSGIELTPAVDPATRMDRTQWPAAKQQWATLFAGRTRDEWCELLAGSDACVAPVLDLDEAPAHRFNAEREAYTQRDGRSLPTPAPRLSGTPLRLADAAPATGADTDEVLAELGYDPTRIAALREQGAVG